MNSLPSTISPFFPFESGPSSFIEAGEWLALVSTAQPTGKMPAGFIQNIVLSVPARRLGEKLSLSYFMVDYSRSPGPIPTPPSFTLYFRFTLGGVPLTQDEFGIPEANFLINIATSYVDGSTITNAYSFIHQGENYRIVLEIDGKMFKDLVNLSIGDPYTYTASSVPMNFLSLCTRAKPANPLKLTVINPSTQGMRFGYDPFAVTTVMGTSTPVNVISGYNIAAAVTEDGNGLSVEAGAGKGMGTYPICPDRYVPNAPSGIVPANNDMQIAADPCHPTYIMQHPDAPSTTKLMLVFGNCDACCGCDDYENMFKAVKKIGLTWGTIWDGFLQVNNKYLYAKSKFDITKAALRRLGTSSAGYCNISKYKPWDAMDRSGVFRLYGAVSIYDRQYVEENIDGTSKAASPIRSITLSEVIVKLTGETGASFTPLELSGGVGNTEYPTMLEIAQPGAKPVTVALNPTTRDPLDPTRLIVSGGGFYKIKLRPGATLALDIIGCVNQYQVYAIDVTFKWSVGIEMAELPGVTFSTDLTATDPTQAIVPLNVVYVDPGIQ